MITGYIATSLTMVILLIYFAYSMETIDKTTGTINPNVKYAILNQCSKKPVYILYENKNHLYLEFEFERNFYKQYVMVPCHLSMDIPRAIGQVNDITILVYTDIAICLTDTDKGQLSLKTSYVGNTSIWDIKNVKPEHIEELALRSDFNISTTTRLHARNGTYLKT